MKVKVTNVILSSNPHIIKVPWGRCNFYSSHFTYGEMEAQRRHLPYPRWLSKGHEGLTQTVALPPDDVLLPHPVGHSHAFNPCLLLVQSCRTLWDATDCSSPGSVHGVLQARMLECVAVPSSRGSSQPRCRTWVSYISCIGRHVPYPYRHLGNP